MSGAVNNVAAKERKIIVTKKDLLKVWWKWTLAIEASVSFDRTQAPASGRSMNKVLRKLYKNNPEELQATVRRHISIFDTNYDWGGVVHGIMVSLEEQRASDHDDIPPEVIQFLKLGLIGSLAGIGDSVDQGIVATIPLAIPVPVTLEGSVIAAPTLGLVYIMWGFDWFWSLFNKRYSLGENPVLEILHSGAIKKVIDIASVVSLFIIGCLSASYIKVQTIVELASDTSTVKLREVINGILPNMLPSVVAMGVCLYITKRGSECIRLMTYTMIIVIVLAFFHIIQDVNKSVEEHGFVFFVGI